MLIAKLYLILLTFRFLTHFLLRGLRWAVLGALSKNHLKFWVHAQAITPNPKLKIVFSKLKGLNPPLKDIFFMYKSIEFKVHKLNVLLHIIVQLRV